VLELAFSLLGHVGHAPGGGRRCHCRVILASPAGRIGLLPFFFAATLAGRSRPLSAAATLAAALLLMPFMITALMAS
jgi:hypothetical protein